MQTSISSIRCYLLVVLLLMLSCKSKKTTSSQEQDAGSAKSTEEQTDIKKMKLSSMLESFNAMPVNNTDELGSLILKISEALNDPSAVAEAISTLGNTNFYTITEQVKTKAAEFKNQLLSMNTNTANNNKDKTLTVGGMPINDVINKITDVIEKAINIVKNIGPVFIVGNSQCGTIVVTNDDLKCKELADIAKCVKENCTPPAQLVWCNKDPNTPNAKVDPNMDICKIESGSKCNPPVPPGACIPKGKTAEEVQKQLQDTIENQ